MAGPHSSSKDPDWRLVRAFVAVMQEGTLSAAARRLGTTQPTVGRQIRQLEETCGEVLFLRRGTSLEPTPAALGIHARAGDVDAAVRSLGRAFARLGESEEARIVRITAPTLVADHLFPSILPDITEQVPRVQFHILPSDLVQDLQRRHADIALRLTEPTQPDLIARRIGRVELGFFATRRYLSLSGVPETAADLESHRLITPLDDAVVRAVLARAGLDPGSFEGAIRSDDLRYRHAMMKAGLGIATGHDWMARHDPDLVRILPDFTIDVFSVWLVATEDIRTSRALGAAYDALGAAAKAAIL